MSEETIDGEAAIWSAYGSCATADPDIFFPEPGGDTSQARSICRDCPVRRMCLDHALETQQKYGIWGGMTESQRRRLRRDRNDHPARPASVAGESGFSRTTTQEPAVPPGRHLQLVR